MISLKECEELARDIPMGKAVFTAVFPAGPKNCAWLDQYMGLVCVEGVEGFMMVKDLEAAFPDLKCSEPQEVDDEEFQRIVGAKESKDA